MSVNIYERESTANNVSAETLKWGKLTTQVYNNSTLDIYVSFIYIQYVQLGEYQ